ncbi:MAG TPA: C39 family peptidase [Streptosporangiaceae bacterium]|nr:C39 family peptidase [Streptosporangiaceae bacterium]
MDVDGLPRDSGLDGTGWLRDAAISVPVRLDCLPDGRQSLMIGRALDYAAFNHPQGDNPEHDHGDCGVVCCAEVLSQFGVQLTEADVVRHASRRRELHVVAGRPDESGWTLPEDLIAILHDYGVPAHAEQGLSTDQLAAAVQRGCGVIAAVNAGVLWSDPRSLGHGDANHAVTVNGVAREPYDGALQGVYINDSATGRSAQFVSAHLMVTAFARTGGFCVVTDIVHVA